MAFIESCAAKIRMSTKAQGEALFPGNDRFTIAMARAVDSDLLCFVTTRSPLAYDEDAAGNLLRWVREDVPFEIVTGPLVGASAPASLAGAITLNNAEALGGIVLSQVLKPGHPVAAAGMMFDQNMSNGQPLYGAVANSLIAAASAQVWKRWGVSVSSNSADWCDSKMIDWQAGTEMTSAALTAALAGTNVIYWHGGLCQMMVTHPVKAVLDDELAANIGVFLSGIPEEESASLLDLIDTVGPAPGHFLGSRHTREHWREGRSFPSCAEVSPHANWLEGPPVGALDLARQRVEHILATHEVQPISASQEREIEDILKEAREHYHEIGMITDDQWRSYQDSIASPAYPAG